MNGNYSGHPILQDLLYSLDISESEGDLYGKRTLEIDRIINTLSRKYHRSVLVYGQHGVGKTTLIRQVAYKLQFTDYSFFYLRCNKLLSKSNQEIDVIFTHINEVFSNNKILIIDDINILFENEIVISYLTSLLNTNVTILATIDSTFYVDGEQFVFLDAFEKVHITEPLYPEVYPMIKKQVDSLQKYHGVRISKRMTEKIIYQSICYNENLHQPQLSIDTIDMVLAHAAKHNHNVVRLADIHSAFKIEYLKFNCSSLEQRRSNAIHESGHLAIYLASKDLGIIPIAVSILSRSDACAVTHCEIPVTFCASNDLNYYVHLIAAQLAGKVVEDMYNIPANSGFSEDFADANSLADKVVNEYGFNWSEKDILTIDDVLSLATEYAEKILLQYKDLLDKIVKELTLKGILTFPEIQEIWNS